MEQPVCHRCRQKILRLETYFVVGCIILCDECYMNMSTKEFFNTIGGEVRVME